MSISKHRVGLHLLFNRRNTNVRARDTVKMVHSTFYEINYFVPLYDGDIQVEDPNRIRVARDYFGHKPDIIYTK